MSETAKWYVIHTYSGYENKVAQDIEKVVENRKLHDMILEVRVPTEKVTEITDGKIREVERKTFPSYVLLKMIYTDDTWHVVKNIRGVTGFVGPGSEPTPLSEQEVQALGVDLGTTIEVNYAVDYDQRHCNGWLCWCGSEYQHGRRHSRCSRFDVRKRDTGNRCFESSRSDGFLKNA